jgi:hypothetical protein
MADKKINTGKIYGEVKRKYTDKSIRKRLEALFLDNIGKILTREQILEVAKNPETGKEPENWHQRLSELRTDDGYTILSWRDSKDLQVQEYLMPNEDRRKTAGKRIKPNKNCWAKILERANYCCEWSEAGELCNLHEGEIDPVGGGKVKLTPDHKSPHSFNPDADPDNPVQWQALCGRHQVVKKNFWDNNTGKLNVYAILQAVPAKEKKEAFYFLLTYFGYMIDSSGQITKKE